MELSVQEIGRAASEVYCEQYGRYCASDSVGHLPLYGVVLLQAITFRVWPPKSYGLSSVGGCNTTSNTQLGDVIITVALCSRL